MDTRSRLILMNGYQRYMAMLAGENVDFPPRTPILMQFAAEFIGSDYAAFASDHHVLVKANVACAREFGIDQLSCISDPYRETHGFGSKVTYMKNGPPHSTHPLQETKDLSALSIPDPLESERMLDRVKAAELYHRHHQGEYSILGWVEGPAAEAADLRNLMPFLIDLLDDEPFACELMDLCTETAIRFARAQLQAGADTIGIGDAIASQVGPDTYEELIQPREKRLVQAIQEMGGRAKLHICGNITHLLPGIADLGVDVLDVDHMVDLSVVRAALGSKVAIAGNMDPVSVVRNATPDGIRDAVRKACHAAGFPYLVNAGCEIPSGTPACNLRALCEPMN
jgi:MtaA/CmuA family methyltransferase